MSLSNDARSIADLFGHAVDQLGKLVHNEVKLARAEISEKMTQAGMGFAFIGAAAILVIPVLVVLLLAFALWLTQTGVSPVISHLIAAAVGGVVSVVLALIGISYLKPDMLTPKVTIQQVERDLAAAKELAK